MVEPVTTAAVGGGGLAASIIAFLSSLGQIIGGIISQILTADKRIVYILWVALLLLDSIIEAIISDITSYSGISIGSLFGWIMFFAFGIKGIDSNSILFVTLGFTLMFMMFFFMEKAAAGKALKE